MTGELMCYKHSASVTHPRRTGARLIMGIQLDLKVINDQHRSA
jgi:hypothetical protein